MSEEHDHSPKASDRSNTTAFEQAPTLVSDDKQWVHREQYDKLARSRRRWIDAACRVLPPDWNGTPDDLVRALHSYTVDVAELRADLHASHETLRAVGRLLLWRQTDTVPNPDVTMKAIARLLAADGLWDEGDDSQLIRTASVAAMVLTSPTTPLDKPHIAWAIQSEWGLPINREEPAHFEILNDPFKTFVKADVASMVGIMLACPQHDFWIRTVDPKLVQQWFAWVQEQDFPAEGCMVMGSKRASMPSGPPPAWPPSNLHVTHNDLSRAPGTVIVMDLSKVGVRLCP